MSFNDSFGPNNNLEEDKNNNISFEGNQNNNISFEDNNNNNNISFEENRSNEENNLSFDNMKIDEKNNIGKVNEIKQKEEKQNDIFNSVPMEIKKQENQDLLYYENQLIAEKIKYNIHIIFNIIKKNLYLKKSKFFQKIKSISNSKLSKLIRAEIMFINIQNKLSVFNNIERKLRFSLLKGIFTKLKLFVKIKKYKDSQDKSKETEIKNKIKEMNDNLKKSENNLKEVSNNLEKLKQNEKNINNDLEEINKKNNKLNSKYASLVAKSKELKEAINQKMTNFSSTLDKSVDPRIVELQMMIKNKEKDKEKSMNYFEDFYKKMSDILDMYEANYENIKSTINSSEIK